jgi:hypothetical protein
VGRLEICPSVENYMALSNLAPYADVTGEELPDSIAEWRNAVENYEIEVSTGINNTTKT